MARFFFISAVAVLVFLTCNSNQEIVGKLNETYIPSGNYIIKDRFYSMAVSPYGIDTFKVYSTQCKLISGSVVNKLVTENLVFSQTYNDLTVQLYTYSGLGSHGTESAVVFGLFTRLSPNTGVYGDWQLQKRLIISDSSYSVEDSLKALNYTTGIGWLSITPSKFIRFYYPDSLPPFVSIFKQNYQSLLNKYDVHIDSISENSLHLSGNVSGDIISISRDETGTISYSITLTDPEMSEEFQPNPFQYNPEDSGSAVSGTSPCQDFPDWINRFLENNPLKVPE